MPIYEYFCDNCFTKFELLRPFTKADSETPCKICSSSNTRRMLSKCISIGDGGNTGDKNTGSCGTCSGGSCNGCHQ